MSKILTPDEFEKVLMIFEHHPFIDEYKAVMDAYRVACHYATWTLVYPDYDEWNCSNCDASWTFEDGTPQENNVHFCPVCGAYIEAFIRDDE